jgi:hypothetical protein
MDREDLPDPTETSAFGRLKGNCDSPVGKVKASYQG